MRSLAAWVVLVAGCGGGDHGPARPHDAAIDSAIPPIDAKQYVDAPPDASGPCNPLTQAGCSVGDKCTWLIDVLTPQHLGHIGCAPSGTGAVGDACSYGAPGATGYDTCEKGLVCSGFASGGTGVSLGSTQPNITIRPLAMASTAGS